ncbi:RbsD/FucU domain-containing protein [Propionimicrobium sp. PCR01-08-3]|uniref:RbsD/FucU family protein n=1 Tax=Propionimicrobium sp. PCR01-08-3 TaxID=3052086 RepID=UPI00255C528C|nr:RbsD/FucU domain-containing protein [Propionimicrobium sp. PCR01-08-3]WIY83098.1 RbsD/FucU domain-containing protein [Propionimicrobium sp. PCR01-08-3]
MALLGIDPLLTGELLGQLDAMGHSDAIVVADAHFPAQRLGRPVVELPGLAAPRVAKAIRSVILLDGEGSTQLMETADGNLSDVQYELIRAVGIDDPSVVQLVERFAFYREAAQAAVVVRTGESRPYGNLILHKGTFPLATAGGEVR